MDLFNVIFWNEVMLCGYCFSDDGIKFCEKLFIVVSFFGVWEEYLLLSGIGLLIWDYDFF